MIDARYVSNYVLPLAIFSVPFGTFSINTGLVNLSPPNLLIIVTFAVFIIRYRRNSIRLSRPQVAVLVIFAILILYLTVTTFVNSGSPRQVVTFVGFLLFIVAVFVYVDTVHDIQRLLHAAFLSAVVISVLTIVHILLFPRGLPFGDIYIGKRTIAGFTFPFQRSLGIDISYGAFGMYTMIAVPYYAYLGLERRSKSIVFYLSVVLVAVLLSQSRSTWAATGVAAFVVVAGYWSKSSRKSRRYATIAAVSLAVAVVPFLARVLIAVRPDTLASRIEQYQEGLEIVLSFPLLGVGFGNIEQFYSEPGNIHSAFLDVTAAAGIFAFLLILIIWSVTVLFLIRGIYPSQTKLALAVGLIASLGAMLIESNLQPGFTKAPWITLALALSVYSTSTLRKGTSQRDEHI